VVKKKGQGKIGQEVGSSI